MAETETNAQLVRELWQRMSELRFQEVGPLFTDDFICDWPLTRERIRGREHYIALNEAYPRSMADHN
jgi:hypothetical protein